MILTGMTGKLPARSVVLVPLIRPAKATTFMDGMDRRIPKVREESS